MDALAVIHIEFDPKMDQEYNKDIGDLSIKISAEIRKSLSQGKKVYFLGFESADLESELIHPRIKRFSKHLNYIPMESVENQFLLAKNSLIEDKIEKGMLCGISYGYCVSGFESLLLGRDSPSFTKDYYRKIVPDMGWTKDKFEQVYNHRIEAKIIRELT
ncbi:hypothetical protein ISS05_00230 [Candidatus Woesearchaeota archaeon]|nr:hypothetical protein [Candidatus Woesearchaeota archaeon]